VFRIKGRSPGRSLPLIAADEAQVALVARLPPVGLRLAARFWPGPLTLVAAGAAALADGVAAADGTVAVRVPDHEVARALARGLAFPITATSANRSGEPPSARASEVRAALGGAVEVVIDAGDAPGGPPSTIVDVTSGAPRLVRAGAVAWDRVLESLK
jgi:L-threonylcarbamoyladenylate synthase